MNVELHLFLRLTRKASLCISQCRIDSYADKMIQELSRLENIGNHMKSFNIALVLQSNKNKINEAFGMSPYFRINMWGFPFKWGTPNHPFIDGFPLMNQPFWGFHKWESPNSWSSFF